MTAILAVPFCPGPPERAEQALRESEVRFRSWQMDPAGVGDGLAAMGGVEGQLCKKRSTARELGNVGIDWCVGPITQKP